MRSLTCLVSIVATLVLTAMPSSAQDGYVRGPDGVVTGVIDGRTGGSRVSVGLPKGPISITLERKSLQTLWDGTHMTRVTHETFVRDSKGRTRTETEFGPIPGTEFQTRSIVVTDPVAELSYVWQEGVPNSRKIYTVRQTRVIHGALAPQVGSNPLMRTLPDSMGAGQVTGSPGSGSATAGSASLMAPPAPPPPPSPSQAVNPGTWQASALRPETTLEPLGQRVVGGLACVAQRTTTVFPVDYFGNDRPIKTVDETCTSQEAGRVIQETREDPRTGVQTITLVAGSTTEPDASQFLPPADYTEKKPVVPRPQP